MVEEAPLSLPIHYIKELNEHMLSLMPTIEKPEIAIECHPGYLTESEFGMHCANVALHVIVWAYKTSITMY